MADRRTVDGIGLLFGRAGHEANILSPHLRLLIARRVYVCVREKDSDDTDAAEPETFLAQTFDVSFIHHPSFIIHPPTYPFFLYLTPRFCSSKPCHISLPQLSLAELALCRPFYATYLPRYPAFALHHFSFLLLLIVTH